jgi:hypothetical protein
MNEYAYLSDTMYVGVVDGYEHTSKYQALWGLVSDAYKVDKDPFYLNGGKLVFSTT